MADYAATSIAVNSIGNGTVVFGLNKSASTVFPSPGSTVTTIYKMQAWDLNSSVWRYWDAIDEPDPAALQYDGPYGPPSMNFQTGFFTAVITEES